jgi:hypothetical protein
MFFDFFLEPKDNFLFFSIIFAAISRWVPKASMVSMHPSISNKSSKIEIAVISFDLSSALTCPKTS